MRPLPPPTSLTTTRLCMPFFFFCPPRPRPEERIGAADILTRPWFLQELPNFLTALIGRPVVPLNAAGMQSDEEIEAIIAEGRGL